MLTDEEKRIIRDLIRQAENARDRAVKNGDRLVKLGEADINRSQFLAVVNQAINRARSLCGGGDGENV